MPNTDALVIPEDFTPTMDAVLGRVRAELLRQLQLQHEGRFERACSDPCKTDKDNFIIAIEESLEVTREMQNEPINYDDLEAEIVQAAATCAGWLISRARRKQTV